LGADDRTSEQEHADAPSSNANRTIRGNGLAPLPQDPGPIETIPEAAAEPEAVPEEPPWAGPFLGITRTSSGIYLEPNNQRRKKIGYAQEGAVLPVKEERVKGGGCSAGWYEVVGGGYVCSDQGTTNVKDPRITNAPRQPNLDAILPFTYARNTRNGAPLYKSVPSDEQQRRYEPYLFKEQTAAPAPKPSEVPKSPEVIVPDQKKAREDQARRSEAYRQAQLAMLGEAALKKLEAAEGAKPEGEAANIPAGETDAGADDRKWWQKDNVDPSTIKLADLSAEGDDILAQRLVKGFYLAVDRKFRWNGRQWFRSTKGYVAPMDTFHQTTGPDFQGVELDETWRLPIGWAFGFSKTKNTYEIDVAAKKVKVKGSIKRLTAVNLTPEEVEIGKHTYVQTADGTWMRKDDLRITTPGPPPAGLAPNERWLDIDLSSQTAVLFEGTRAIYATLVSTGKTHSNKDKDHSTPTGEWRIREKHITATMDGDGTAAGDMPYSIEAVPYVMYFHKSYAVHGAFWHENFGVKMSHGCINMAPLDAKYVFFHTDPPVRQGWQGAWSSEERVGSVVVVHD
jgi:hypothetical protein